MNDGEPSVIHLEGPPSAAQMDTTLIPVGSIRPNEYNPNRMTDDEYDELVAEVRHLRRLPKPVIVRPDNDGFEIVDGEHGWRAACDVGLTEVTCELVDVDDFEAMRQTYKRNQHGTHNQVLLGQMFQKMMQDRGLSQRKLAEDIGVSEGTIRNGLEYAKAAEVRNDYAFGELSLREVRIFNRLPKTIGGWWLEVGAGLETLFGPKWAKMTRHDRPAFELAVLDELCRFGGLEEFIKPVHSKSAFVDALKTLREWYKWEQEWLLNGITRETLRRYTEHYFRGVWQLRTDTSMDDALNLIVEPKTGTFALSPEEFSECVKALKAERGSARDLRLRVEFTLREKGQKIPENRYTTRMQLREHEMQANAPDFIKSSTLDTGSKWALFKEYQRKHAPSEIATLKRLAMDGLERLQGESAYEAVRRQLAEAEKHKNDQERWEEWVDSKSEEDLSGAIVDEFYDETREELRQTMKTKLAAFTKAELLALYDVVFSRQKFRDRFNRLEAILARALD